MRFRRTPTYRVTPERDEWVAPEESLVDAGSTLSNIEVPVTDTVFRLSYVLVAALGVVLVGAVGWLGIVRFDYFSQMSFRNRTVNVSVPPPRGIVMDRNGIPLIQNVPSFDVLVISRQVQRDDTGVLLGVASMARLLDRSADDLSGELEDGIRRNAVFFAATDLTRTQVLGLRSTLPTGFSVITSTKRQYVDAPQFSQIIGYVGKVSKDDMVADPYYVPSDTIGRLGIEAQYEGVLRGLHGQMTFQTTEDSTAQPSVPGQNLVLAVDAAVQKALFETVRNTLREAGLTAAAAIVQDPRDGSVLALQSFPSYDNNVFNGSRVPQSVFDDLFGNRLRPLFDRVISGKYNPGSTIKPYIGMTALQTGIITPSQVVTNDCISISVPNPSKPDEPYVFKNWRPDTGPFDLYRAIADSCNIFFFTVGGGNGQFQGLGVDRIIGYLRDGNADRTLGIDLPGEQHGFLPTPDWKYETKKEPWYQGDTYNISIGQGDLLVTPLWINSYVSAIANGGTLWQPRVASRVVDEQRSTLRVLEPRVLSTLPFSPATIQVMQRAMRTTVTDGTGKIFKDLPVTAAAKTGTAEVIKGQRINSLVTVYAPATNPQVAVTVLIEGSASNQGYALQAAHDFLVLFFDPSRTTRPVPTP